MADDASGKKKEGSGKSANNPTGTQKGSMKRTVDGAASRILASHVEPDRSVPRTNTGERNAPSKKPDPLKEELRFPRHESVQIREGGTFAAISVPTVYQQSNLLKQIVHWSSYERNSLQAEIVDA